MKNISLPLFTTKFLDLVSAPTFGEPYKSELKRESPPSKELRRTEFLDVLKSRRFCKNVYWLSQEYWRLEAERKKVPGVTSRLRPAIYRLRSATKRLDICKEKLEDFTTKYGNLTDERMLQKICSAISLVDAVSGELERRKRVLISGLHPAHRNRKYEPSAWKLIVSEFDYDLHKVGANATDQWFWIEVNTFLLKHIEQSKAGTLSAMTRFKLIAAIAQASGHSIGEPSTIKQFFADKPRYPVESL